ncbi:TPM domain-containing protein [Leptospira sp. 'Mane']|uniref:TPM domain-containing protein n=1 Tax=Leptospira sp. 'Mane' TaxID=3387407 RepID=UPI00398B6805
MAEPGTLSSIFKEKMEGILAEHEKQTTNQIAILAVQYLDGENLEEYGIKVAEKWMLGQKGKDNGVLVLLAVGDRKVRIEVGYGLEGTLTDVYCSRVIKNTMIPLFKEGNYEEGLEKGILQIIRILETGEVPTEPTLWDNFKGYRGVGEEQGFFLYILGLVFVGIIFTFAFIAAFHKEIKGVGLFFFLLVFFQWIPTVFYGFWGWVVCNGIYLIGFPIIRLTRNWLPGIKDLSDRVTGNVSYNEGGGGGFSGSSSDSSFGSSGGFSSGGGSFGGGGSSGSW